MEELELVLPSSLLQPATDEQPADSEVRPPDAEEAELVLSARQRIVLRCGKASLTLHANGKILLRGEYILSEAEDVNRIAGGRIELN